jgi:hypothetical protein
MNNNLPPQAVLMHLVAGKFVTQALAAAAELNLAEYLVDGPRTAGEIAEAMGVHTLALPPDAGARSCGCAYPR